eukprot:Skav206992  [mRNA]  locus=scaffold2010:143710:148025:- [translate_table: standard]
MDLNRRFAVGVHRILRLAERARPGNDSVLTPVAGDERLGVATGARSGSDAVLTGVRLEQTDQAGEDQEPLKEEELKEFQELHLDALEMYMQTLKKLRIRDHQVRRCQSAKGCGGQGPFNLPIMLISARFAVKEQEKSLKSSSVKLAARDVVP